ncbi:MAG: hypothetical protein ACT4PV_06510 [Planctomycetaceae bacterium]
MPTDREPPSRALPIVYFAVAHAALLVALAVPALDPESVAGFFYHPRMFAVVHLITLGWITLSILGATYVAGPIALRLRLRAGRWDAAACAGAVVGIAGVIAHFWIARYGGIAWSALLLLLSFGFVALRVVRSLPRTPIPLPIKLHLAFGYGNLLLAVAYGLLLALNKDRGFLQGSAPRFAFGHAHLAGAGWATMMVLGVGYRLLPMFLPAEPPTGRPVWLSGLLLQLGVLGLAAGSLLGWATAPWFASSAAAGIACFVFACLRMIRRPRPAPPKLKRPDLGMFHAFQAVGYLVVTTAIGLALAFARDWKLDWIMTYGVLGLLGFLGQIVIGIAMRLLPMYSFAQSLIRGGHAQLPPSPFDMPSRPLQSLVLAFWSLGVPVLAFGLHTGRASFVSMGAWALLAATLAAAWNTARVLLASRAERA